MGNPSSAGFIARQPNSRTAATGANSSPTRRPPAANSQGSSDAMLLHGQVAKLRNEERFMSEEVETEGVERLAIGQILSSAKDFAQQQQQQNQHLMPSPLGLQRTFAASG